MGRAKRATEILTAICCPLALLFFALAPLSAPSQTEPAPPSRETVLKEMGIPSTGSMRGQKDSVGYASNPAQMAEVWELAGKGPEPESLGQPFSGDPCAVICPHDDFIYAGRVYRKVLPLVRAKKVVVIGVFHQWRKFGERDRLVFDTYSKWRTPDGDVPVSSLREAVQKGLEPGDYTASDTMHDAEYSAEALVYWLRHGNSDLEIVPVLVPPMGFDRMSEIAGRFGKALASACSKYGWEMGRDVAIAISCDGIHYGPDFGYTPYGEGGAEAYSKACANDKKILGTSIAGEVDDPKIKGLFEALNNPADLTKGKVTWCGRFSAPFGLLLLKASAPDGSLVEGHPLAYATSVGWPELQAKEPGLGKTAPCSLYHFVGYPAAAFTVETKAAEKEKKKAHNRTLSIQGGRAF